MPFTAKNGSLTQNTRPPHSSRVLMAGLHDVGGALSLTTLGTLTEESLHPTAPPLKAWPYPSPILRRGRDQYGRYLLHPKESRSSAASAALFTPAWTEVLSVANQTRSEQWLWLLPLTGTGKVPGVVETFSIPVPLLSSSPAVLALLPGALVYLFNSSLTSSAFCVLEAPWLRKTLLTPSS